MEEFQRSRFFTTRPLKFRELAYKREEARFMVLTVEPRRAIPEGKSSLRGQGNWHEGGCHTRFLCQNHVLIVCMTHDQLFHTYGQKCSQITKCHE
jgi:hypothetical protein